LSLPKNHKLKAQSTKIQIISNIKYQNPNVQNRKRKNSFKKLLWGLNFEISWALPTSPQTLKGFNLGFVCDSVLAICIFLGEGARGAL